MESIKYCLDTDILIDYLRGQEMARDFLLDGQHLYIISTITVAEIYSGKETKHDEKQKRIEEFLQNFFIIPVTIQIAQRAGELRRDYNQPFADMIVAATALQNNMPLVTRNIKHYKEISSIVLIKPY